MVKRRGGTLERIASSMGVVEAIAESGRLPKATRDLRSIKNACGFVLFPFQTLVCFR